VAFVARSVVIVVSREVRLAEAASSAGMLALSKAVRDVMLAAEAVLKAESIDVA